MASKRKKKKTKGKRKTAARTAHVDVGLPRLVREDGGPSSDAVGDSDELLTERASATPIAPATTSDAITTGDVATVEGPFHDLLDWFSAVATHPRSAADGVESARTIQERLGAEAVESIVKPNDRMSAVDRMALYQYSYHARLVGCLEDDFPTIVEALGASRFDLLARKYIEAHPSDHPNLNHFGRHFPEFCAEQGAWLEHHRFVRDLARLEWAIIEMIHAPSAEPVSMKVLEHLPQEQWADIRLVPAPTLRFLEFDYPANAFLQAHRRNKKPTIPAEGWSATAVYRVDFTVWRMGFTRPMTAVLQALIDQKTLGEALGRLSEPELAADIGETDVMRWFKEWVVDGFFERVVV